MVDVVRVISARQAVIIVIGALAVGALPASVASQTQPPNEKDASADSRDSICLLVESAARAHNLPVEFFARVIWQESRFQADSVGPLTRSGQRAQGIAQFMPTTAAERRLLDPFDPVQALPKSAEYLAELRNRFGNLGLAAAAYNAGPQRVSDWLSGVRTLPAETRNYVATITGLSADDWANGAKRKPARDWPAEPNCQELMVLLKKTPNAFVAALEQRVNLVAAKPWGVQLAAGFSRSRVLSTYARLARRYVDALKGHDPSILTSTLRTRGTHAFYQVRAGADTRASADRLCAAIRRAKGACMVLRNTKGAR
jgi:hypothetical protein